MIRDHELRYSLTNELHARPFPVLKSKGMAVLLAIRRPKDAALRDRGKDIAHLVDLLRRFGDLRPEPNATHFSGQIGRHYLKWESHTEFVTYTLFADELPEQPFDGRLVDLYPADWLENAPGERITSALIRIEPIVDDGITNEKIAQWFVPESVTASCVLDNAAVVAADFRIDPAGHGRMAVFVQDGTDDERLGRIVQRATEIEIYKTVSMLGLAMARELNGKLNEVDVELAALAEHMKDPEASAETTLEQLLRIAAVLEDLSARTNFRFGATGAYEALVNQRIEALRETRFKGRQTLSEFMMRRFDPAMRTVKSAERRLSEMTNRAFRAGELLRTRVDVERSAQNQKLLESMDKRADLQLRLQQTVEGLSVVAISYYAVNLGLFVVGPLGEALSLGKSLQAAVLTPPVIFGVWLMVQRIKKRMH